VLDFRREQGIYVQLRSRYEGNCFDMFCYLMRHIRKRWFCQHVEKVQYVFSSRQAIREFFSRRTVGIHHVDVAYWYSVRSKTLPHVIQLTLSSFFELIIQQSKNTCAHNNTQKAHANGIKKAKRTRFVSTRGMDPKFLRNQKFAKKYNGSKRVHD